MVLEKEKIEVSGISHDILPIKGTDYIELYVGNAKQSTVYYEKMFGFKTIAYKGPETGCRDRVSYCLAQGKIRLVITGALSPDSPIAEHVKLHGDGVKVIALWVDDAKKSYYDTLGRGAVSAIAPQRIEDEYGYVLTASIKTYGDTIHTFVERKNYFGEFLPGFKPRFSISFEGEVGFQFIDHCVGNVQLGAMNHWVKFYEEVLGFKLIITFDDNDISTEYSSLMSKVVSNGNGFIKFPINEPADGIKKSQIEEFLDFYKGAGVQHIAIATNDIVQTITELRRRGVEFLYVPDTYYEGLKDRVGNIIEDINELKKLNILVDRDDEGYLLQLFTKPIVDRPTLFFEIIQRRGAKSFGKGNFKALFESLEREQSLRGNL